MGAWIRGRDRPKRCASGVTATDVFDVAEVAEGAEVAGGAELAELAEVAVMAVMAGSSVFGQYIAAPPGAMQACPPARPS
jgi:hypothetical protein